ncbi:MobV family relaxase [Lysinibacillus capsici]|uniref:MobV family relaxase n=1 Tax=Lysinibacillus capsici TaxID=2115968 RepID=UPI002E216AB1|nr:MobV family relaxase [Lysinibacillus capsici]
MELAWNTQKNQITDVKGKENEQERKGEIRNDDIDLERTKNNYDLVESDKNLYQRVKQRVDELKEAGSRVQKNSVVMYSNILTVPQEQAIKWGEQKTDDYFKACYEFFCEEFGKENVVSGKIHKDETAPHMHLHFVPVNKENGKLQARVAMNKEKINYIHDALPKFLQERGFDVVRASGKAKENNIENIHEYKEVQKRIAKKANELEHLQQEIGDRKKEFLVLSEKLPAGEQKIRVKGKEVKTTVTPKLFGKPEVVEKETENFIVTPQELKSMQDKLNAAYRVKADYERLQTTDLVQENKKLREKNKELSEANNRLYDNWKEVSTENRKLKNDIGYLKARINDLKGEIQNVYKSAKNFLKERTEDARVFKSLFKDFVERVKQQKDEGEFEKVHKREQNRERSRDFER